MGVMATCKVSGRNCVLAWCCSGPRAAHTFAAVGVMSYWPSLLLMSLVPCCTLWFVNSKSDLNVKLGGERRGLCMGCLCACCCSCCVIAQDAEALTSQQVYAQGFVAFTRIPVIEMLESPVSGSNNCGSIRGHPQYLLRIQNRSGDVSGA